MNKTLLVLTALTPLLLIPTHTPEQGHTQHLTGDIYALSVTKPITIPPAVKTLSGLIPRTPQDTIERRQLEQVQQTAWMLAGSQDPYTPVEPDPLAEGCSSGAAYYLAYTHSTQKAAATGCLTPQGKVLAVSGLQYKYDAAVACNCVDVFYAPIANKGEIQGTTLPIKYVEYVGDMK